MPAQPLLLLNGGLALETGRETGEEEGEQLWGEGESAGEGPRGDMVGGKANGGRLSEGPWVWGEAAGTAWGGGAGPLILGRKLGPLAGLASRLPQRVSP